MKTIIITNTKFKQDTEKIINILIKYYFKKINETTYIGEITLEEKENMKKELTEKTNEKDNLILIPLCEGCYKNITQYGIPKNLDEGNYVIL